MDNIKDIITKHCQTETAHVGIGFKNLRTNETFFVNGDDSFPLASVYKIFILIELFNQSLTKRINLNSKFNYSFSEISLGSGILSQLSSEIELPYIDYARLMMIISDNTATDVLANRLGKNNINQTIVSLELKNTRIELSCNELILKMYGVDDSDTNEIKQEKIRLKNIEKDCKILVDCNIKNNVSTPKDIVEVLSKLYFEKLLDSHSCRKILNIMRDCQTNSRIPRYIPDKVSIAHKTGTLDKIVNDVGIVYANSTNYILAVFYNGNKADNLHYHKNIKGIVGEQFIAELSKKIYDYISK